MELPYTRKQISEAVVLLLFVVLFLSVHAGRVWDYRIQHEYPYYFNANDNFFHSEFSDYVKGRGSYDISPYYAFAGFTNVVGYLPPILYHLSAGISLLTGLETYDTTYMAVILLVACGALLVYFSVRKYSEKLAILSLPFMVGVLAMPLEIPFAWGLWVFLTGSVFLMAVVWYFSGEKPKHSFLLLAIFLSGSALGHAPELLFSLGLVAVYFIISYLQKNLDKNEIKETVMGIALFAIISAYYLIIFYFTYMVMNPFTLSVMEKPMFAPNFPVNLETFGYLQYLLILGLLVTIISLLSKEEALGFSGEKTPFIVLAALYIFLVGFTNYIGFGVRAFQMRTVWPILLSVLMALPIYSAFSVIKRVRFSYIAPISVVLLLAFSSTYYSVQTGGGMMDGPTWEAFRWIMNSTEKDAKVFWFYSVPFVQEYSLFSSKRIAFRVDMDEYVNSLKGQEVKTVFNGTVAFLPDAKIPYRNSTLSFGYHADGNVFERISVQNTAVMDYFVFGISNIEPAAREYNRLIISKMLESGQASVGFSNNAIVILRNSKGAA